MSIKKLTETDNDLDIHLCPGDTVRIEYDNIYVDQLGNEVKRETQKIVTGVVETGMIVNKGVVFEFNDEFGMEHGVGGVLGYEK